MILNGEAMCCAMRGRPIARKLRQAGVEVTALRIQGTIHDSVMFNVLDQTAACRAAVDTSAGWILRKNQEAHLREAPTGLNFGPSLAQYDVLDV